MKRIIRSILGEFINLFASNKCIAQPETELLDLFNILLKGSSVKFYGVETVKYEESQARLNILQIIELIRQMFPEEQVPSDLKDLLAFLLEDPLNNLEVAKNSCDLCSARERRELLVQLHTEYMTHVRHQLSSNLNTFFANCPYLETWMDTVRSNTYLQKSVNLESKRAGLIVKEVEKGKAGRLKKEMVLAKGEFQFAFMRNSNVHIPEKAQKVN